MNFRALFVIPMSLGLAGAAAASDHPGNCCDEMLSPSHIAGSTDCNYLTDFERLQNAAIEAIEEEANVKREQIDITDKGGCSSCSCGHVVYLRAPYIEFSCIKVRIDDRGKDSGMPELSVTITSDKFLFTRHKEFEQRIHELVQLKLRSTVHGDESRVSMIARTPKPSTPEPATKEPAAPPAPAPKPDAAK